MCCQSLSLPLAQTKQCNKVGSLANSVNMTNSEIEFCHLWAMPEGRNIYHLAVLTLGTQPNTLDKQFLCCA